MRFRFVEDHRSKFPVIRMCKVLAVSPSGYYVWRGRPPSKREMANRELTDEIKKAFEKSGVTYGSPRIYQAMRKLGLMCSKNRVARLMRKARLTAKRGRQFRATTKRNKAHQAAPNRLNGDFRTERPNEKWLADITYIRTQEGWLYLAALLDLFSRGIVGWAMSGRMTSDLTVKALKMAISRCRPEPGLIHHSDQGSQYTAKDYQTMLEAHRILPSMNGVGTWYDNAPMESFFATLKSELVNHRPYRTRDEASQEVVYYIEGFYNRQRLHSSLGYASPVDHLQSYRNSHEWGLTPCPQN
jgi:transposase InsO family protein